LGGNKKRIVGLLEPPTILGVSDDAGRAGYSAESARHHHEQRLRVVSKTVIDPFFLGR
jgi:hypothetical protein